MSANSKNKRRLIYINQTPHFLDNLATKIYYH